MQSVSEEDTNELSDAGKEEIGLNGDGAERFTRVEDEGVFEDVNGSFNGNPVPVKVIPVIGVSGDTRIETEILVRVSVNALAISGIGARKITGTNAGSTLWNRGGANPFEAGGTVFTAGLAEEGKGFAGNGANRSAGGVEISV